MYFCADTLDDLMNDVLKTLVTTSFTIEASRSKNLGKTSEVFGVLLQLNNPRARLSKTETKGKAFSALGELLWYLTKSNEVEFIKHYIPQYQDEAEKDGKIHGGYGPRLFNMHGKYDQIANIIDLLKASSTTRRAVIQVFDASDNVANKKFKDIPCTCTLQFAVRDGKLNMFTSMRSNDAFFGLPHDVFSFTMLQEIIARSIGIDIGIYTHAVGSLHLYEKHKKEAEEYLNEGYQSTKHSMPEMPKGDPWESINKILSVEPKIRKLENIDLNALNIDNYWEDFIRLLQIHSYFKELNCEKIKEISKNMNSSIYNLYIENKLQILNKKLG